MRSVIVGLLILLFLGCQPIGLLTYSETKIRDKAIKTYKMGIAEYNSGNKGKAKNLFLEVLDVKLSTSYLERVKKHIKEILLEMENTKVENEYTFQSEIITAIAWHDINRNNLIEKSELTKIGENNFKKGEGFIIIAPNKTNQKIEIIVTNLNDNKVIASKRRFLHEGTLVPINLNKFDLSIGCYELKVVLSESNRVLKQIFWIY